VKCEIDITFLYVCRKAFRILTLIVRSLFLAPNLLPKIIDMLLAARVFNFCNLNFTKIIKYTYVSSNTSCFIVCEAKCFGPYMTIIRPTCESS